MNKTIKLKKGVDIRLKGRATPTVIDNISTETYAIKPPDFAGIKRPKLLLKEGDQVKAGTPVLYDKMMDQVMYVAPVSGEIIEVNRGEKRKILEVVILADKNIEYESFGEHSVSDIANLGAEDAKKHMLKAGVWPQIIQRPYGIVANPEDEPKMILISAFDSHPLAPDYDVLLRGQDSFFQAGIDILRKFTKGVIHLNIDADAEVSPLFSHIKNVQLNKFSGPHPSGNPGVQIHHLDPLAKGEVVWTVNPYGVAQIGKLFLEGKYDASKLVAFSGSELKTPQYYKTFSGCRISKFMEDNLTNDHVRFISGNVLTGTRISREGFLGYYDHLVSVIPEGDYHEMFGWILPSFKKFSIHRALGLMSWLNPSSKEYVLDTNNRGEARAFVETGVFEKVTPMDILPTYLIKAIMAEDYDNMEALGIYEVIEEDLALCEFVDVSKHPIQQIVRDGIELMMEG